MGMLEVEKNDFMIAGGKEGEELKNYAKIGPISDIISFSEEVGKDGWTGEFCAIASLGANALSAAFNPIATATGWVAAWIIDHINPLHDFLQKLTGDSEEIQAGVKTWNNISKAAQGEVEHLESLLKILAEQKAKTLDAYRSRLQKLIAIFNAQKEAAEQISLTLEKQGSIVAYLYSIVRDLIAEAIGMFCQSVAVEVFSLGTGTPVVVAQISAWVGKSVAKVTKLINKALDAFAKLSGITAKLVSGLRGLARWGQDLIKALDRIRRQPLGSLSKPAEKAGAALGAKIPKARKPAPAQPRGGPHHEAPRTQSRSEDITNTEDFESGKNFFNHIKDTASNISKAGKPDYNPELFDFGGTYHPSNQSAIQAGVNFATKGPSYAARHFEHDINRTRTFNRLTSETAKQAGIPPRRVATETPPWIKDLESKHSEENTLDDPTEDLGGIME